MAENTQARRTRRWAVPTHLSGPPVLKGLWWDSPETKAREPQRPGDAPLWGWKTGVQNGSLLGLGDWGCRVASLQGQVARAAVQCLLSSFFSSRFPSKAAVPAVVALTVRRLIFHKQQSSPLPAAAPLLYLKGRGLHGWRQKHPTHPCRAVSPEAQTQGSLSPHCSHPLSAGVGLARTIREGGNHT